MNSNINLYIKITKGKNKKVTHELITGCEHMSELIKKLERFLYDLVTANNSGRYK